MFINVETQGKGSVYKFRVRELFSSYALKNDSERIDSSIHNAIRKFMPEEALIH